MKKLLLVICAMLSLNIAMAQKNVLVEEVTGTWCTYCPSGMYYLDSLQHTYDNVIAIAIHASWPTQEDPMAYQEYFEKTKLSNAPSANIGRRFTKKDVNEWFDAVAEEMKQQPKASVSVTTEFDEATRLLTAVVTVTALENLEGNYTISGVVTEDAVTGTSSLYNQSNIYAKLYTSMGGFENMPDPIPYYRMAYDHVARQMLGGYEGQGGLTPLAKDQQFAQTFTYYVPENYDHNYLKVVGMLLDGNGLVDNAGISVYANGKTNAAPKFTSLPVVDVPAGTEYIYDVYFHDTDNKDVVVSVEQKPEWLTLKQIDRKSAKLSGVPSQAGEYVVVLKVSDGADVTYQEFTITVKDALNASWETLGERAFTQVGYGFIFGTCSYNGDVYTFLYESGLPALYRYDSKNKTWRKLATIMEEMGYDGSIAAGTDGVYVTYNLKSNNLIKVMKYANDEWSEVGNIGKIGSVPKIVVDAQNSVYVAFNDAGEGNRYYLNRYKNGNWETMGSYITAGGGSWARLALDSKGAPYVSWVDFFAGNKMYVSKLVGENWVIVGGDIPVSEENFISKNSQDLAIDANGNIYLAYVVKGTDQLAVYRHNGADWEMLGDNVADGTVKGIDVAVDSENNFYVAYADGSFGDKVSVMKYNGTEWSYVGQRAFTESSTDTYMAMTLHNESPCVVYTDIAMGSKASAKYYQLAGQFSPVSNLEAKVVSDNDIELTWNAPFNAEPTKYNIYRNDALIGNTAKTSYVDEDLESGIYNYAVTAVYEDGESEKATATATLTVSVAENNEVVFTMYPNPAKDFVTIESAKDAVVKIYSVNGQMLSQQNINEGINTIDLSNLNAGMYFISVDETMVKIVKK